MNILYTALIVLCLCSVSGDERMSEQKEGDQTSSDLHHIHVKGKDRWYSVADLESAAKRAVVKELPNIDWGGLKEMNTWIESLGETNLLKVHFSFGLGKQSFLISVNKAGEISQVYKGVESDKSEPPPFVR